MHLNLLQTGLFMGIDSRGLRLSRFIRRSGVIAAASLLFVGAAAAQSLGTPTQPAQLQPKPAAAPAKAQAKAAQTQPAAAPAPAASLEAASAPRVLRSEVATHDFWTVACDYLDGQPAPRCMARMPVFRTNELKQVLVVVAIAKGANDQWMLNLHMPTSMLLQPGAELRFGDKARRKMPILSCEPALCTATLPFDAALRADLTGSQNATAVWTSLAGGEIRADFPLKGAAAAIASLK